MQDNGVEPRPARLPSRASLGRRIPLVVGVPAAGGSAGPGRRSAGESGESGAAGRSGAARDPGAAAPAGPASEQAVEQGAVASGAGESAGDEQAAVGQVLVEQAADGQAAAPVRRPWWRSVLRRPAAAASAVFLLVSLLAIAAAGLIAPYGPVTQDLAHRLEGPSAAHLMGTDTLGRDVLSRLLHGGQLSVPASLVIVAASLVGGSVVGLVAGYLGGAVDNVLMRVTDVFFAFPVIILAMAVSAALGPNLRNGVLALAAVMWPLYARVVRSVTLELRSREFVDASRIAGRSTPGVLAKVILPNAVPTALVVAAVDVGRAIVNLSVLSFIGLGAVPPQPEWGSMVSEGATVMDSWWVSAFPGLAIFLLVLAVNLIGDAVRDALDVPAEGRTGS